MATQATGTRETNYDLVSILYHALQAGETYQRNIQDAEQAREQDLAQSFRDVQEEEKRRAERAQQLLAQRPASVGMRAGRGT